MKSNNSLSNSFIKIFIACFLLVPFSINASSAENTEAEAKSSDSSSVDILSMTPAEVVEKIPQGEIKSPFVPTDAKVAEEGHTVFMETSCNGCHGGTGGGGMGPPLSNQRWVYGNDVDTLFRLITLGTIELQAKGYTRKARENVRAPMPAQASGAIVIESLTTERILKIINWIQSLHVDKK